MEDQTTHDVGVTYTLSAFKRAKFVGGGKSLVLRADQDADTAERALGEAAGAVNDAFIDYENRNEAYVVLAGPTPTPSGPMLRVRDCEPATALPLMLDALAAELVARGITGHLAPIKPAVIISQPKGVESSLGMVLAPVSETDAMYADFERWRARPAYRGSWVDEHRHHRIITTLVEWLTEINGQINVEALEYFEVNAAALVPYLTEALRTESMLGVRVTTPDGRTMRRVSYDEGEYVLVDYAPDRPRDEQLASLTDLAVRLAPDLAYSLVREMTTSASYVRSIDRIPPATPLFKDLTYTTFIQHLEADYVFDAGVAQVLTTSQLTKTSLPAERWTVRDLGDDRHLVTANDPAPWLIPDPHMTKKPGTLMPDWTDHEAIATSRADFGPAILTLDTLRQNPPPLTPEQVATDPDLRQLGVEPPH